MEVLTVAQLESRYNEAYHSIVDSGTDGFISGPGLDVDVWISNEYTFFVDVNGHLCAERDGGEFVWDEDTGEWCQGTWTSTQKRDRYGI